MANDWLSKLGRLVGPENVLTGDAVGPHFHHDESLTAPWGAPAAVVTPSERSQVGPLVETLSRNLLPIVPRGAGTGLSGGANPSTGSVVLSTAKLNRVLDVSEADLIAEVEAGVTLAELDQALLKAGLIYPVYTGEMGATIGGNLATNAGGMRAVRYGVTRHNVTGLDFVDGLAKTVTAGGRFAKMSSGYDLTQLFIGSEGTLGVAVRALLRLRHRPPLSRSLLICLPSVEGASETARNALASGVSPGLLEYLEPPTFLLMASAVGAEVPANQIAEARALLLLELEGYDELALDRQVLATENAAASGAATEIFELPVRAASDVLRAREAAFWVAKSAGARDVVDAAIPPSQLPRFLEGARTIAERHGATVACAGHLGDGNVHLSLFAPAPGPAHAAVTDILELGNAMGGVISGEHGIGLAKRAQFLAHLEEESYRIMREIKRVFDPAGIMNPGKVLP